MLNNPECGWTMINIGTFHERASYMTDVPMDCLKSMIGAFQNFSTPVCVYFDAEGYDYTVVCNMFECHIIINKDYTSLVTIPIHLPDLAVELVKDIMQNIDAWAEWDYVDLDKEQIEERRSVLVSLCDDLLCEVKIRNNKL